MIFHLTCKTVSRSTGRSSVAAAAYRSGERLHDERTGETHHYPRKAGITPTPIILPEGEAARSRSELWNMAEAAENRKDANTAREWEVALPDELSPDQRVEVAREFARRLVQEYGVAADVCVHAPNPTPRREGEEGGSPKNHHAHILTTTRKYEDGKLTSKTRALDARYKQDAEGKNTKDKSGADEVKRMREAWARICNDALARAGIEGRIDARSLKDQGRDRVPTRHLGPAASGMKRRGELTPRAQDNAEIKAVFDELETLKKEAVAHQVVREDFATRRAAAHDRIAAARAARAEEAARSREAARAAEAERVAAANREAEAKRERDRLEREANRGKGLSL